MPSLPRSRRRERGACSEHASTATRAYSVNACDRRRLGIATNARTRLDGTWTEHGLLGIRCERDPHELYIVEVYGELCGLAGAEALARTLRLVESSDVDEIIVDLSALHRIDPEGLRVLSDANVRCHERSRRLVFLRGGGQVDRALSHAQLHAQLPFAD